MKPKEDNNVINFDVVEKLKLQIGDETIFFDILDIFFEETKTHLADLDAAHKEKDTRLLRRTAHSMKSNGRTFGAIPLANKCFELEEIAQKKEMEGIENYIKEIKEEYKSVHKKLKLYFNVK